MEYYRNLRECFKHVSYAAAWLTLVLVDCNLLTIGLTSKRLSHQKFFYSLRSHFSGHKCARNIYVL